LLSDSVLSEKDAAMLRAKEAATLAEWCAAGEDRRRWPLAPLGLLAIWIGDWTGSLYAFLEDLAYRVDSWSAPSRLYRWGHTVWPSCPFCGAALLTSFERHRCK
jgi:hypothetical protein